MANILLLEDDLTLAMHYREWLEEDQHIVFHEVNCDTAKLTLQEVEIQLIISDIILRDAEGEPMINGGLTLLSYINLNMQPRPKAIAITGTDPKMALIRHAESLNIDGTLIKPLTAEKLSAEVTRVLAED